MASAYWAWTWPTGDRRSYKQHICAEHVDAISSWIKYDKASLQTCYSCEEEFKEFETVVTVWFTLYVPKRERYDGCLDLHVTCHEQAVDGFMLNAERLRDRPMSGRGAPRPDLELAAWDALGIYPVEST
jgi:hypothetical protein